MWLLCMPRWLSELWKQINPLKIHSGIDSYILITKYNNYRIN